MNISAIANVPAMNEPSAEIPSAGPACPACHLMTVETRHHRRGFPGMLTRIDVVDPPYIEP